MPTPAPLTEAGVDIFEEKEDAMARFRTVAAAAIFLFGTTFLSFMPSFLGTAQMWREPSGRSSSSWSWPR